MKTNNENANSDESFDSSDCYPSRVVTGDPIPVGEYVLDELEAREWSIEFAASRLGPEPVNQCWLELVCTVEIWQQHEIKFGDAEAAMLETIFGVSKETWINLHNAYETQKSAERN